MKPYIICHMMTSVDGRIDCDMVDQLDPTDSYYKVLDSLECPSQLMGRVTMQMHYADSIRFVAADTTPIGRADFHVADKAAGYTVAIDTHGCLRWPSFCYDGKPLLVITSESCPGEYLQTLTRQNISWIAVGEKQIDLVRAMEVLNTQFGVQRLAVVGGGHINGAFLDAGLLDEVSVMIGPGIDAREGMASVFDGLKVDHPVAMLKLQNVSRLADVVWLRYTVK